MLKSPATSLEVLVFVLRWVCGLPEDCVEVLGPWITRNIHVALQDNQKTEHWSQPWNWKHTNVSCCFSQVPYSPDPLQSRPPSVQVIWWFLVLTVEASPNSSLNKLWISSAQTKQSGHLELIRGFLLCSGQNIHQLSSLRSHMNSGLLFCSNLWQVRCYFVGLLSYIFLRTSTRGSMRRQEGSIGGP